MLSTNQIPMFIASDIVVKMMRAEPIPACFAFCHSILYFRPFPSHCPTTTDTSPSGVFVTGFGMCYNKVTHDVKARHCRPRTSSPPTPTRLHLKRWRCVNSDRSKTSPWSCWVCFGGVLILGKLRLPFFHQRRNPAHTSPDADVICTYIT